MLPKLYDGIVKYVFESVMHSRCMVAIL